MDEKTREEKRDAFLRIYANLPLGARNEVIAALDDPEGPVTWEVAYLEIKNRTAQGIIARWYHAAGGAPGPFHT